MLKESDFIWKIRRVNDIPSNPLEYFYVIVDTREGSGKLYAVKVQPEIDENGRVMQDEEPKYFIFCEGNVNKSDKPYDNITNPTLDGYDCVGLDTITVYDDISKAMHRAYANYKMIYGYVMKFAENYDEKEDEKHFLPHSDNEVWNGQDLKALLRI